MAGYSTDFLGDAVSLPNYSKFRREISIAQNSATPVLEYIHYSAVQNAKRKLPLFTAVNISGIRFAPSSRKKDKWFSDDRLNTTVQLDDSFYKNTQGLFSRGHLVRRLDPAWGRQADKAQLNTFYFTNCCPQHQRFNAGIWLELEKNVLEKGCVKGKKKISVFSGPVLNNNDPYFDNEINGNLIRIPLLYWKIIVYKKTDNKLYAVAFLQSQLPWIKTRLRPSRRLTRFPDDYFEKLKFKDGNTYQVKLSTIEKLTGLKFKWKGISRPYDKDEALALERIIPPKKYRGSESSSNIKKVKANEIVL